MENKNSDIVLRLESIIDTAIDGIITINRKGIVESMNKSAAALFKYDPQEVIGNNISMLMPEPDHSNHDAYIKRYVETRQAKIIGIGREVSGKKKDGSIFPFRLAVSEVILHNRVIFTGIVHDLSDIKKIEQKLIDTNEVLEEKVERRTKELEEVVNKLLATNKKLEVSEIELTDALSKERDLNELKSRFVSMASHEFRTPLSTIMSSAALISKYEAIEQQDNRLKHVERIKSAVTNLTGILNDFLSLSKLEEGKIELQFADIVIEELCNSIKDELEGLLKEGQSIVHNQSSGIETIKSDKRILKNIMFNLISNAIKYSPENSEINCSFEQVDDTLVCTIKDQGIGIPEAEQKHLFSRFFRASNVETIQGTGLGLNIVKRYIDLLKGHITFESKENEGSSFMIHLPINSKFNR